MGRFSWVVTGATAAAVTLSGYLVGGWGAASNAHIVGNLGMLGFAAFASVCAVLAARSATGRQRTAWICLTIGTVGWMVGEVICAYYQFVLELEAPLPSVADIAYLIYPLGACLALLLLPVGIAGRSLLRLVLDGIMCAAALFVVSWVLVLRSVLANANETPLGTAVSLAYPVSDIVVITVALLVLAQARSGQRTTLLLLTTANIVNAISDSAFVYLTAENTYQSGHAIDVGWIAALLMLALAALVSRRELHLDGWLSQPKSRASIWLPYLPVALAVGLSAPMVLSMPGMGALLVATSALIAAVLARQFLAVGENRRLLETVAERALRDPLTGLANRTLFHDRLTHAMQLHQRDRQAVAVMLLDLDDFKLVNDSLGHAAGDMLLTQIGVRLVGCARTGDTVARLGGDEFAILMEGKAEGARRVANRIVEAFDEPFLVDEHELEIRPSIGLAVATGDNRGMSADALLKQADIAMYTVKRRREGGVHAFTPDMYLPDWNPLDVPSRTAPTTRRSSAAGVRLLGELRHAVASKTLSLFYQPKFDLLDGGIVGVEALVRWQHPERGLLVSDEFLPLVRRHGLTRALTEFVVDQALDDAAEWRAKGVRVPIAVNVFAPSLGDLDLPTQIENGLRARNLGPNTLTIEITEDLLLENMDQTRAVLERLRSQGIRVAIDDFGSGYSALWYLLELSIDEVKIDRQFIAPVLTERRAAAIVRAIVGLSDELGVTTVAEGVEDAATGDRLRELGCDVVQGYHYSPPLPASDMLELLAATARQARSARARVTNQVEVGTKASEIELMQYR